MAPTRAGSTAEIAFRSVSSRALASAAACCDRASCDTAESITQYFKSPKCLLAELAFRTTETSVASSARLRESRVSSRIRSAEETARIASNRIERKISRARIDTFGIMLSPLVYRPFRLRDQRSALPAAGTREGGD